MKQFINQTVFLFIAFSIFFITVSGWADTLVLKNGMQLEGNYKGGTESTIKFETGGALQEVAISEIVSLTFSSEASPTAGTAVASESPAMSGPVTIPAGTVLMVKIDKAISTASHQAGAVITGILDTDLVINGKQVAPKGTQLYGNVLESIGGKRIGNQKIAFQFTSIVIKNEKQPISTDVLGAEGGKGGALKTVAGAAIIGGAIDGREGAKTGALIGAGASVIAGGKHIQIPAGTLAELPLKAPLEIN